MLKFAKSVAYLPDPVRSRPHITDDDKTKAAATPPAAVPFHCKPWLDGQSVGWTLFYGYLTAVTITVGENGRIHIPNLPTLARETNQPNIIQQFAASHFGLGLGYTLQTPPGFVSLLLPSPQAPAGLTALTGIVETDWYPRQIFAVFQVPPPGITIQLDYQTPVVRVVVIPRHEQMDIRPLTETEQTALAQREATYLAEEAVSPSRWVDEAGNSFTHLYKQWSAKFRHESKSPQVDGE
ncbi:MAG: hypothetical protein H6658_21220 [Ardenticatenaceae bacterium]|nr:hypothetical protein [Ardenticatenaceae bacterium]